MRTLPRFLAGVAAVVLVAGCSPTAGPAAGDVAATVGGSTISRDAVASEVRVLAADLRTADASERAERIGAAQREVLGLLIQARIIEQLADEHGVTVDPEEVDRIVTEQVEGLGGEEAFEDALRGSNLTLGLFAETLVPAQVRIDGLLDQLADELETRTVRHILLETEEQAEQVVEDLAAGADFAELAAERSLDPGSAERGGDLGPAPRGAYVDEFDDAAWEAELDTVIGPIATGFGFHVLEVTAEGELDADELSQQQRDQVLGPRMDELLADAFQTAEIEVEAGLGVWDSEQARVMPPPRVGEGGPQDGPMAELEDLVDQ